jgi:hypothetical protein
MVFGVIYGYYRRGELQPCYVGKAYGVYSVASVLNNRHKAHLRGKLRVDAALRESPESYDLQVMEALVGRCAGEVREPLRQLEYDTIVRLQPCFNRMHHIGKD